MLKDSSLDVCERLQNNTCNKQSTANSTRSDRNEVPRRHVINTIGNTSFASSNSCIVMSKVFFTVKWVTILTLSLPNSKSKFSKPFKEKCLSEVVRIGSIIVFHLSNLWNAKLLITSVWCNISGEAAGETWSWSLLGVKGLSVCSSVNICFFQWHPSTRRQISLGITIAVGF